MKKPKPITIKLEGSETPRNLLVFMDGTWNDENGHNNDGAVTNIYKMFSSLYGTLEDKQIPHIRTNKKNVGFYFRGVGNDEDNIKALGFYQGLFGAGEKNIRDHAYATICKHYRPGDRICIFGFSRGASSARLLASKLNEHGLPKEITLHYKEAKNKSTGEKEQFFCKYQCEEENSKAVSVSFLGLFDTVGAFGIPLNLGPLNFQKINLFRDLTLAKNIEHAVHLVAIDESREPFVPTLTNASNNVEEVWFPGVHADIGGGYRDCVLGNITLDFMVNRLNEKIEAPHVSFTVALKKYVSFDLAEDDFIIHYHGDGIAKEPRAIQSWKNNKGNPNLPVKIHQSALTLQKQNNFFYSERLNSFATKIPITYDPVNLNKAADNINVIN
jgi:uncharacterized protein (DUF2235 family)